MEINPTSWAPAMMQLIGQGMGNKQGGEGRGLDVMSMMNAMTNIFGNQSPQKQQNNLYDDRFGLLNNFSQSQQGLGGLASSIWDSPNVQDTEDRNTLSNLFNIGSSIGSAFASGGFGGFGG